MHRLLVSPFDQCSDHHCGWVAAIIAALSYGTFGVPIKETISIDVHPLVLQSYKTLTMFIMSWLVVLMGETIRFTPWGILSGLLWVVGGTGGIYAIRNAGMSVAVGTWSSVMVSIDFLVGIIMFQEPVDSISSTLAAFVLLGVGLVGMAVYSAPTTTQPSSSSSLISSSTIPPSSSSSSVDSNNPLLMETELMVVQTTTSTEQQDSINGPDHQALVRSKSGAEYQITVRSTPSRSKSSEELESRNYDPLHDPSSSLDRGPQKQAQQYEKDDDGLWRRDSKKDRLLKLPSVLLLLHHHIGNLHKNNNFGFTKRQLGVIGAIFNGLMTGSSLVPIHYAKKHGFGGSYVLSFATGALLANLTIWIIWSGWKFLSLCRSGGGRGVGGGGGGGGGGGPNSNTASTAYMIQMLAQTHESMPSFHFRQLWAPGFSAGILLAIAMFGSIMSITYLGQGVGNSIIQSKILISGLWGIFWYKEISGGFTIMKWFASAALAVSGILWLSYERIHAKAVEELHV